ncbi:MAG: hypothetical protein DI539_02545 [Flavobacterium psychrophilum]|nr:MAG: hypothetical protein DI539_02545 [Flavobacterium psychrophilum]
MNKKILIPAVISIVLQLFIFVSVRNQFFSRDIRINFWVLMIIFYIAAIPYSLYQLFKKNNEIRSYKNGINIIGTLFTLPLFFITLLMYYGFEENHTPEDINPEDIHLYTSEGREINITDKDSFFKDTGNIDGIKIDEAKQ